MHVQYMSMHERACTHHHVVFGYPAVRGEVLQHRHHEGQAAVPVAQQQHHANQVDYTHHSTGQVVSHVENLTERERENNINLYNVRCSVCHHELPPLPAAFTSSHW